MPEFKVDENLPIEAATILAAANYDAVTVGDQHLTGQADSIIADVCNRENRALITLDLDFCDIRLYRPANHWGIIVLRLTRLDKHSILSAIGRLIRLLNDEPLRGKLWIVEDSRVRIRS